MPAHPDRVRKNYGGAERTKSDDDSRPNAGRTKAEDDGRSKNNDEPRAPRGERERAEPQ
jgi:hypothetical protein